ncbi:ActS/PrrB/RegB family redox-sensitive histidine kinase [Asticcacaulis solisilvae]|uniref:ActS/PrrB/RegB family redox-sensitive histidine kinase n=1 Tax=Asticcacaulis solisilvae TaxID=1217274 RepID=UPI003FD78D1D
MPVRTLDRLSAFFNGDRSSLSVIGPRDHLRLRTLVLLRWLAIAGQSAMVFMVSCAFGFHIHIWLCVAIIMASVWLNLALAFGRQDAQRLRDWEAALQLGFDAAQLAALLGITGGLNNPFCLMLVAPATIAAANLPTRFGMIVVGVCMASGFVLAFWSLDLPWIAGEAFALPEIYRIGMLVALLLGIVFTAGYSWQASLESARMEQALAATQAVLEQEHRMSALGGLAAAAAHELGTPLGTIQVVAKEMLHSLKRDDPLYEDAELLVSQSQRCRDILKNLSARPERSDSVFDETTLRDFLASAVAPYTDKGKRIDIAIKAYDAPDGVDAGQALRIRRRPEWLHALSAFVENASDFARSAVLVRVEVTRAYVSLRIEDDGPGFAPDILSRLGEPYISSRVYGASWSGEGAKPSGQSHSGMGLGFFIAKTLCEHTGARVTFGNRDEGGAYVKALWRRDRIDILYDRNAQ